VVACANCDRVLARGVRGGVGRSLVVGAYLDGSSIDALAASLGVNRTTIISHLDRRGIDRRKAVRKMNNRSVLEAARHYGAGESLKVVAARFDVDARTLARELLRIGVPIRRRRGWSSAK
jgi:hypothetical protein